VNRYHVEIHGGSSRAEAATKGATLERCRNAQSPAGLTLATDKTRQRTTHYIYNYTNPLWREGYRNMQYAVWCDDNSTVRLGFQRVASIITLL